MASCPSAIVMIFTMLVCVKTTVYWEIYALQIFFAKRQFTEISKKKFANCLVVVVLEMEQRFSIESCVRGFHIYKDVWNPLLQEILSYSREPGNVHDPYAVAVKTGSSVIVGHVPRTISTLCSIFISQRGTITCQVTGERRYSHDLPQGGLELPCRLTFSTSSTKLLAKVQSLSKDSPVIMLSESGATDEPTKKKMKIEVTVKDGEASINAATSETYMYMYLCKYGQYLLSSDEEAQCKGEKLNDRHINFAQALLKAQFSSVEALGGTSLQDKPRACSTRIKSGLQIVLYRDHWISASNVSSSNNIVVYDSAFP